MSESFNGSLKINVQGTLVSSLNLGSSNYSLNYSQSNSLVNGTGANQSNIVFANTYTISASGSQNIDLYGGLTDVYGSTINFTKIKGLVICASSSNTNNVLVGGAASNAFFTWCDAATDQITVRPGGTFALFAPDSTAYAVTSGTADILKIANSGSGTSVVYDIILIGVQ